MTAERDVPGAPRRRRSGLPVGDLLDTESVTVDLATPATALAVGAHPDDVEFGAGATLAKWAASGCRIHHLILTDGSKGSWDPDEDLDRLVAARQHECREAAARIGAGPVADRAVRDAPADRVEFLGRVDGELVNGESERREVARVIRSVRPDVVLGHDPWRRYRLHPDHRTAGFLTLDAIVAARDPHFVRGLGLEPHRPSALLLWEADLPNHVEGVSGFEMTKVDALLCHSSQLETTMGLDPTDADPDADPARSGFASQIEWQLAQHGALVGLEAGEAFRLMDDL